MALLKEQDKQKSANQAVLKRQTAKLKSLTTNTEKTLEKLRKQAEVTPSAKVRKLKKQIDGLNGVILTLSLSKAEITSFIQGASETLERLDGEIIEADTIYKDLLSLIVDAKKKLKQAERDTTFQVAVISDLQNDLKLMEEQHKKLEASRIFATQEQVRLSKLVEEHQAQLDTINAEIPIRTEQLEQLLKETGKVMKKLGKVGDEDKVIRESLATKELKLQEDKANLAAQKAEIKKDLLASQQLQPKLKLPKVSKTKGYYKI